jgi:primosomal protein N'
VEFARRVGACAVVETILLVLWALVFLLHFGYVKMATLLGADGSLARQDFRPL